MSDSVEQRTCRVVAEVFGLPPQEVTLQTSHENVEDWDSLNLLNVLMSIEGEFGVSISPDEAGSFVSVAKIVEVLRGKGVS